MIPSSPRLVFAAATVFFLLYAPSLAQACAVCSAGRDDETRIAFIWTAAMLSVMPLALVAGLAFWLRGRVREMQRRDDEARRQGASRAALASGARLGSPGRLEPASRSH